MIGKKKKKKELNPSKKRDSGLASFTERPLPNEKEVVDFEKAINRELRDQEIDSHLIDVYSDKRGQRVDVSQMNIKKKPNIFFSWLKKLIILGIIIIAVDFIYAQIFTSNNDISAFEIKISSPERVAVGEEFSYEIEYYNPSKYVFSELFLEMQYPENFLFDSASIDPVNGNYGFSLDSLGAGERANLTIKGSIYNSVDSLNLAIARISYLPGSFSSEFKKEASTSILINSLGFSLDLEKFNSIFVEQENELKLFFSNFSENLSLNKLEEFDILFNFKDASGAELISATSSLATASAQEGANEDLMTLKKLSSFSYHASDLKKGLERQIATFNYKVKSKVENFELEIALRKKIADKEFIFWRQVLRPELISSDLSLNLILNGSKNNQSLDFGSVLNYTLNYSNKGNKSYKDVVIMTVLEGDALDWESLNLVKGGELSAGIITWSKNNLKKLEEIKAGESGEINFSIKLDEFTPDFLAKDNTITSYAQYSVAGKEIKGNENSSNKIVNALNSDLKLKEELRYFNDDNYPVGSGPLPPRVGEKTEFRVYWTVENNLHDLREVKAVFNLPAHVSYISKEESEAGNVYYNSELNQVVWDLGLVPSSKYKLEASFSLAIIPEESDRDKILVLSPGSVISAIDTETNSLIEEKTGPKTSRLEDDEIAALNNSGRVE